MLYVALPAQITRAPRFENAPGGPITMRLDVINLLDEIYLLRAIYQEFSNRERYGIAPLGRARRQGE
jgi:hypothetical protein